MTTHWGRSLVLALAISALVPTDAHGTLWIQKSFYERLQSADDVLVVHVDSTGGPRYGQWAQVSVRRSFKGRVTSDSIRFPFEYDGWPVPGRNTSMSSSAAHDRTFEAGQRLLVLVYRRSLRDTSRRSRFRNPYAAQTRYVIDSYPSDSYTPLSETETPIVWAVERLFRARRAETVSAQAAALRPLLRHDNPQIRRYGAGAARESAPTLLAPLLLRRFEHEKGRRTRRYVTEALAKLDHPEITPALLDAAPEYEPALSALGKRTDASLAEPLMRMYEVLPDTADEGTIVHLFRALSEHAGPAHVPTLIRWYEEADSSERWDPILHLIGETHTENGTAFVGRVLENGETPARRIEAAEVVKQHGLDALAPLLLRRFDAEPNPKVRRALTETLSELAHPKITPTLLDAAPTYRPALRALAHRSDTTLAEPLIQVYQAVADTAGRQTMGTLRSALETHLPPSHSPTVARWYRQAETTDRRRSLLHLIGPMKTPTSDSLLAHVLTGNSPADHRRLAVHLLKKHGTRHPDALLHTLNHAENRRLRQTALRALGSAGYTSYLDAITDHAPPPCALPEEPGFFETAWQTITGWMGSKEPDEAPWTPAVLDAFREMGRANVDHPQLVMDALAPYLACRQFEEVPILAAKTLFALDPVAARPVLRNRLAQEPVPRVRKTLRHLVWMSSRIDSS